MWKIRFIIIGLLIGLIQPQVKAQYKAHDEKDDIKLIRNAFHGSPKMRGGAFVGLNLLILGGLSTGLGQEAVDDPVLRWLVPTAEMDFHIPLWSLEQDGNYVPLAMPDWWSILYPDLIHNYSYSFGYEVSWKSLQIPLGAYLGCDFEGRQICIKSGKLTGLHRMTAFVPSAGVRIRLLGNVFESKKHWNIVLDGGAAYNHPLKYKNFFEWNTDAVGRGFRSRVGLIFSTLEYGSFYLRWEKDLYELFNVDFQLPDGGKPFDGMHNNFNSIIIGYSVFI